MSLISTLPVLEGAKIIVIDEGAEANYAQSLITAWLPVWKLKDGRDVHLLLFSGPKNSSKIHKNSIEQNQLTKIHDFYSLGLEETETPLNNDDEKKLWEIPELNNFDRNSTVIIDSLSSLLFYKSLKEICKFIDKLSQKITQLVCIYQRDFTPRRIPSVNTLGTSYVRLEETRGLKLEQNSLTYKTLTFHCKPGGGILQQIEIVEQNMKNYEIKIEKTARREAQNSSSSKKTETSNPDKIQASFRIEINDREMEQRNATPLPYTLNTNPPPLSESKIHYEPDEIDDLDEEDPDDDLDF